MNAPSTLDREIILPDIPTRMDCIIDSYLIPWDTDTEWLRDLNYINNSLQQLLEFSI